MKGKNIGVAKCATHTQEILETYASAREAAMKNKVNLSNLINVLKRDRPVAYGYYWESIGPARRCKACGKVKNTAHFNKEGVKRVRTLPICMDCQEKGCIASHY